MEFLDEGVDVDIGTLKSNEDENKEGTLLEEEDENALDLKITEEADPTLAPLTSSCMSIISCNTSSEEDPTDLINYKVGLF